LTPDEDDLREPEARRALVKVLGLRGDLVVDPALDVTLDVDAGPT
jgi:hypothetical protein